MSDEPIRLMVVDDIMDTRENLKKLLLFEKGIEVVGAAANGEEAISLGTQLRPDVVLMDINMPGIDGISAADVLAREVPGVQIIMMSVQSEADYLRRSMLAGAREFLIKPFSADELITSIHRVHQLGRPARAAAVAAAAVAAATAALPPGYAGTAAQRSGRIITVFGAKGGVGASTVITNLALAIRETAPQTRVALVDGDLQFGDVGVFLNLSNASSIVDLGENVEELDPQYIADVMTPHASGVKVLLAPPSPEMAELMTADQIKRILTTLREQFDYVLVDTATSFGETTLTLLDTADAVLLVTTTEIPAIKNARLFFELSEKLNYDEDKVVLLLNKYDPRGGLTAEAIEGSIKHRIVATISRDERTANGAINQGLPFVMGQPRSQVSLDIAQLAKKLIEIGQPTPDLPAPSVPVKPVERKGSLFGKLFTR